MTGPLILAGGAPGDGASPTSFPTITGVGAEGDLSCADPGHHDWLTEEMNRQHAAGLPNLDNVGGGAIDVDRDDDAPAELCDDCRQVDEEPHLDEVLLPSAPKRSVTRRSQLDRLMRSVDQSGGPDACWPWTGYSQHGYGYTYVYVDRRRVNMHASRAVYVTLRGDLPSDVFVLHSCDNPPCCNPAHLRSGTHLENMADRLHRGAGYARGADNHRASGVSPETVAAIRAAYKRGNAARGQVALAQRFGLSRSLVQRILTHTGRWADVP